MGRRNFVVDSILDLRIWGIFLFLQFPSLRAFYKYSPVYMHKFIPLLLLLILLAVAFFLKTKVFLELKRTFLGKRFVFVCLIILITVINIFIYPVADSLKYQGRGSDQDDALIVMGKNILTGKNPYEAHTYFTANPLSPGPGWVILNLPFTVTGLYFLLTPVYLFVLLIFIRKISGSFYLPNVFLILCCSSLAFWETMVAGSDMFALGAFFTLCLGALYYSLNRGGYPLFWSCFFLALASTGRVVFIYIILIVGIFFWKRSRMKNLIYPVIALIIALALHLIFYLWNSSSYTPLHVFSKGCRSLSPVFKLSGSLFSLGALVLTTFKARYNLANWLFLFCLCISVPLFFVSLGDLVIVWHGNLAGWEGANYLMIPLPIYLTFFVLQFKTLK